MGNLVGLPDGMTEIDNREWIIDNHEGIAKGDTTTILSYLLSIWRTLSAPVCALGYLEVNCPAGARETHPGCSQRERQVILIFNKNL